MMIRRFALSIIVTAIFAYPVSARINVDSVTSSLVKVRSHVDNNVVAEGGGFVVSDGYIVTNAHLLVEAESITVVSLKSGAEFVARLHGELYSDRNLALLRVTGLGLPPLNFSEQGTETGRTVETLQLTGDTDVQVFIGVIGAYLHVPFTPEGDSASGLYQHYALVSSAGYGMPLFNECGDVIGMNVPDPTRASWPFHNAANPVGSVPALMISEITAILTDSNIPHTVVSEECLSAVERAERERASAEERLSALEQATQDSLNQERAARLNAEEAARSSKAEAESTRIALLATEQAKVTADSIHRARADSLQAAAKDSMALLESIADSVQTVLQDSLKAESTQFSSRLQEIIYVAVGILVVLLVGWFIFARKKKAQISDASARASSAEQDAEVARKAAELAPVPAPFKCVLDGTDDSGRAFVVNISELALGFVSGVVLGRSPANSEFLIDHQEVSREHVRLVQDSGHLYVEDLDTLNGTRVNGQPVTQGDPVEIDDGDRLEIGPVAFTVRLIRES